MQQLSFEEMHCAEVANPGEITGLAFNAASNHLAVCNQNSVVQMFTIDATMTPRVIFSVTISNYLLKAIAFRQMGRENRDILTLACMTVRCKWFAPPYAPSHSYI